jgi:hypothetical protein
MKRRIIELLVTLAFGLFVAPLTATAPPAGKLPRIGVLVPGCPPAPTEASKPCAKGCVTLVTSRTR